MKSLWRKIAFILMWIILILGTVAAIVDAAQDGGFVGFCRYFIPALTAFTFIAVYLEHTLNLEKRVDQMYRKDAGLPQFGENAYTNLPIPTGIGGTQPAQQVPMQAVPMQHASWNCPCGMVNDPTAAFCKACGRPRP